MENNKEELLEIIKELENIVDESMGQIEDARYHIANADNIINDVIDYVSRIRELINEE